jgi:PTH2 family peptidyl-tRNA hydrolase
MDGRIRVKQVIVVRKDLKMPSGKLAAQAAHASLGAFLDGSRTKSDVLSIYLDEYRNSWLNKEFTKICLMVNSEEELLKIKTELDQMNSSGSYAIPNALIKDAGHTVFKEPTLTCLGIGPYRDLEIDMLTGHLKLYR